MSQTQHVVCLLIREMGAVRRRHQTIILSSVLLAWAFLGVDRKALTDTYAEAEYLTMLSWLMLA